MTNKHKHIKEIIHQKMAWWYLSVPFFMILFLLLSIKNLYAISFDYSIEKYKPIKQKTQPADTNVVLNEYRIPILMFHYIRDYQNSQDSIGTNLSVSPKKFEDTINLIIKNNYSTVTMSEFVSKKINPKSIVLTFDDGYSDFYQNAYPILKKYNVKAVVYIITGKTNQGGYLSQAQIDEMSASGLVEIGAHSVHHLDLARSTENSVQSEIINSKNQSTSFCYPSGKYNDQTIEIVKNAGYLSAVTTKSGIATQKNNMFTLPRIRIQNNTDLQKIIDTL